MIAKSRKINQIFHQAQLNRLMLNKYLHRIKCSMVETCRFDGEVETQEHFLKECETYKEIWQDDVDKTTNELLDDRNSLDQKAITAIKISKALILRKKNENDEDKANIDKKTTITENKANFIQMSNCLNNKAFANECETSACEITVFHR